MKAKYSIVIFPIVGSVRICVVVDCFCMRWDILKSRNAACLIMPISQGYFHMTAVQFIWTESKCILYTRWSGFILITLFSSILGQTIKTLCIITWLGPQESGVCWTKKIALHGGVELGNNGLEGMMKEWLSVCLHNQNYSYSSFFRK